MIKEVPCTISVKSPLEYKRKKKICAEVLLLRKSSQKFGKCGHTMVLETTVTLAQRGQGAASR